MKVLSFVNQKGGVAKTTSALAIADYFARAGKKVLLIDFDPQGSLTHSCGKADVEDNPLALRFLGFDKKDKCEPVKVADDLWLISAEMGLEKANMMLITKIGKERYLRRAIDALNSTEKYDYVVIDSNPSLSEITMNVLYASDKVIVPFKPEFSSYAGITQLFDNIEAMRMLKPELSVLGFIVTMCDARRTSTRESIEQITNFAKSVNCKVFLPPIRLGVAAADAPSYGKSVYGYLPNSNVAKDYEAVSAEILSTLESIYGT